jgi:hypothetical protein
MARALRAGRALADAAACVLRVDPWDGSTGVFRDAVVVLRLSQPLDDHSLGPDALRVRDTEGIVPGCVRVTGDGELLIWTGARPLRAHDLHFVLASGLRDTFGREIPSHCSRFVPGALAFADLRGTTG